MNRSQRLFGSGPRGIALTLALLALSFALAPRLPWPPIHGDERLGWLALGLSLALTLALAAWSIRSLPPGKRGHQLVTGGAYRFLRHPIYATFLSAFDFGFAVFMDHWIFLAWALMLHPVWHWNVGSEEAMMREEFPEYEAYCARTGRFWPRPSSFTRAAS